MQYLENQARIENIAAAFLHLARPDPERGEYSLVYLGVLSSNDLSWSPHVDSTAHRANQKLGFICPNLIGSPITSKYLTYTSLVRSGMEYAASIWDPVSKGDIRKLEMVQRNLPDGLNHTLASQLLWRKCFRTWNGMTWQTDGRISGSPYSIKSATKMWTLSSVKLV